MEKIVATRQIKPNNTIKNNKKDVVCFNHNEEIIDKADKSQTIKGKCKNKNKFCLNLKRFFCKNNTDKNCKDKKKYKNKDKKENVKDNQKQYLKNKNEQKKELAKDGKLNQEPSILSDLFKKHGKTIGILLGLYVLFVIVLVIVFAKNPFYEFLNRPKILQNSVVLIVLLVLSASFCVTEFFVNLIFLTTSTKNKRNTKNDKQVLQSKVKKQICKLKLVVKQPNGLNLKKLKNHKSKKNIKYSYKKTKRYSSKYDILKLNIYIVLMLLVLCLSFKIKVLWVCVFSAFATCALNVNLLICNKTKQSRILNFVTLLANTCILLSFYLVYLLN